MNYSKYINFRLITIFFLGISSGLPLALTSSALQAWYTVSGIDIITIGALGLVGQPYVYKFIWAPLLDRYIPPFLGRRRGWILIAQCLLVLGILAMSLFRPVNHPGLLAIVGVLVAFLSATQDISFDAYRTDILPANERGLGAAYTTGGYRIGMLISGAIGFILADHIGWNQTYAIMALVMLSGVIVTFFADEPDAVNPPRSLKEATVEPLKNFFSRDYAWMLLIFIVLYKLGDAFALSLNTPFLLEGVHFSLTDVGTINKTVGISATIIGVFVGGALIPRIGLFYSLLFFGLLQAVSNLLFMWLAIVGKNFALMVLSIFGENFCGGLGTAAFVAFLMALCNKRFTAAQFALLSALSAVGRVFAGPLAGVMVAKMGWVDFYFLTFVIALPGLVLLWWLQPQFKLIPQSIK